MEAIAQRWADQCRMEHYRGSDDTLDGGLVGENLAVSWSSERQSEDEVQAEAVSSAQNWYSEVNKPGFDRKSAGRYVFNSGTAHYTQLVWADTEELGCGMVYYKDDEGLFTTFTVCNYKTAGNFNLPAPIYKSGPACSACPAGYTCEDGLCAKNSTP